MQPLYKRQETCIDLHWFIMQVPKLQYIPPIVVVLLTQALIQCSSQCTIPNQAHALIKVSILTCMLK